MTGAVRTGPGGGGLTGGGLGGGGGLAGGGGLTGGGGFPGEEVGAEEPLPPPQAASRDTTPAASANNATRSWRILLTLLAPSSTVTYVQHVRRTPSAAGADRYLQARSRRDVFLAGSRARPSQEGRRACCGVSIRPTRSGRHRSGAADTAAPMPRAPRDDPCLSDETIRDEEVRAGRGNVLDTDPPAAPVGLDRATGSRRALPRDHGDRRARYSFEDVSSVHRVSSLCQSWDGRTGRFHSVSPQNLTVAHGMALPSIERSFAPSKAGHGLRPGRYAAGNRERA